MRCAAERRAPLRARTAPHGEPVRRAQLRAAAAPLLRALRALPPLLLLLLLLCAPACAAALRADVTSVSAHAFSAAVRAGAAGNVAFVVWLSADAATFGAPAGADVWAGLGADGLPLPEGRAGVVYVRSATATAEARAGPGLSSETNFTLFVAYSASVFGVAVVTLDDTPPAYGAGTPRVLVAGASGAAFAVALSEPGVVTYLLQRPEDSPPSVADVLANASGRVILSNASVEQTEYVLSGISGGATYVLYLAAADVATPTPNVKGRLEVMLFSTPLCDPCAAGLLRLPVAADCACAVGAPYEAQIGVATPLFDFSSFARALAAQLGLQLPQIAMLNASAHGDVTNVWLALLPLRPPALPPDATLNLTAALVASGLPPATWAQPFGGFALLAAPPLPGPPATFIVESSRPVGRVFARYQGSDPLLSPESWALPSVPAESAGTSPRALFAFGATLGGAVRAPCGACSFLCRLDVADWAACTSPYPLAGLTAGEHLFQVRALAPDGTPDPVAAYHAWAIQLGPWLRFGAAPSGATSAAAAAFSIEAAPGCALQWSPNGTSWADVPGGGDVSGSAPVAFALPGGAIEGLNTLYVRCVRGAEEPAVMRRTWRLDTAPPAAAFLAQGGLADGAVLHRDAATWQLGANDTDAAAGAGAGVADVQCRLVASPSNATSPAPLFDYVSCGAGAVTLTGLLALPSGDYALQAYAVDAASNAGAVVASAFTVDTSLPLSPIVTSASVSNTTLAPEATSVAATLFYYISDITGGTLLLSDGLTAVGNGSFISVAFGETGLVFQPLPALFSGDAAGSVFGFAAQAADAASVARLGGEPVSVSLTVPHVNSAPTLDASRPVLMQAVYSAGAAARDASLGEAVADVLANAASDADGDAIGMAVTSAASDIGSWEASSDGGASWWPLAGASAAVPVLVGGNTTDRLRFTPLLDAPGWLPTTDWIATATLTFYAWDAATGGAPGDNCRNVSADSADAEAAASRDSRIYDAVQAALYGAGGNVCVPIDVSYSPDGAFSADVGAAIAAVYDAASLRSTDAASAAARQADAARASAVAGCPPPFASAVELPFTAPGAALLLVGAASVAPPWTAETWLRKTARLASTVLLASAAYPAPNSSALLLEASPATFAPGLRSIAADGSVADVAFGDVEAPLGVWTHLAFVMDALGSLRLFVDGAPAGDAIALNATLPLPAGWVGHPSGASAFVVDELRMWAVARSATQIAAARTLQAPASGDAAGLLLTWRFEEGCGGNATDAVSNASATLAGGAAWARGVDLACASVAGVTPQAGPPAGGGLLTLLGAGFLVPPSASAVCIFSDGARAPLLTADDAAVSCAAPPASGRGSVRVSYADPGRGCYAPQDALYTYTAAGLEALQPAQGPVAGGTLVTLLGRGFDASLGDAALCRFSAAALQVDVAAASPQVVAARVVSASMAVCEAPAAARAGAALVELSLNGGGAWLPQPQRYAYTAPLLVPTTWLPGANVTWRVDALQTGPTSGGGVLRLPLPPQHWAAAAAAAALPACAFGSTRPVAARLAGAAALECVAPARPRGPAALATASNGRDWEPLPSRLGPQRFMAHSPPLAELLLPEAAPSAGGATLTVLGAGGAAARELSCAFGAGGADGVSPADARTAHGLGLASGQGVTCLSPSIAAGFVAVRVFGDGVAGGTILQYLAREPPRGTGAFPRVLAAGGGTLLTLSGADFTPDARCAFAGAAGSAPTQFVSSALLVCEAPAAAPGASAVAAALPLWLPRGNATSGSAADDALGVVVAFAAAVTLQEQLAADAGADLDGGAVCGFGSVRVSAASQQDDCAALPAPATASDVVPIGVGSAWQDVTFAENVTAAAASPYSMTLSNASAAEVSPPSGPASGRQQLTLYVQLPLPTDAELACHFADGAHAAAAPATVVDAAAVCSAPLAASALGGFVVVQLRLYGIGTSGALLASAQFLYEPRPRVTGVAVPRAAAVATDLAGKLQPGRRLWAGRPLAVAGKHLPGAAGAACRFGSADVRPAAWVSSALLRCEPPDAVAAAPLAPLAVAHASAAAADDAAWSATSSAALFAWPRETEDAL